MSENGRPGWLARLFGRGTTTAPESSLACRQLVELVTAYLESALPAPERARVEAHLAACPNCARYLEQMRQTIAATGRLSEEDLEPAAREALLGAFRTWKAG
jgi:anti-sigma factor RsiW